MRAIDVRMESGPNVRTYDVIYSWQGLFAVWAIALHIKCENYRAHALPPNVCQASVEYMCTYVRV